MPVETLSDLFLVELKDGYDSEHRLTEALPKLAKHAENEEIVTVLEDHEKQEQTHIERLDTVFEDLGEQPKREECQASKGIITEAETFLQEKQSSQEVKDRYVVTAAQKAERYEITVYENLLQWANEVGMEEEITAALRQNLDEEIETFQELQRIAEEFDYTKLKA